MSERKRKYSTYSIAVAEYLEFWDISPDVVRKEQTELNPKANALFIYFDREKVEEVLQGFNDDEDFHRQRTASYKIRDLSKGITFEEVLEKQRKYERNRLRKN